MVLLTLLPIFGFAFTLALKLKKSIFVSIFFAITSILSTLFILGMMDLLRVGAHVIFWSGTFLLGLHLKNSFPQVKKILSSPPFIIYLSLSFVAFFVFRGMNLFFWDEFSHWGPFAKNMYYTNKFHDASLTASNLFYAPGIAVWNYFTLLLSPYSEGGLYFSYFLLLFSSVLMMYEKIQWSRWCLLLLVFVTHLVGFSLFGHWFTSLYVDHVIGAVFAGIILSYLLDDFKGKEIFLFIFPLVSLFVIKEVGFYFGFSAMMIYSLLVVFTGQKTKETLFYRLVNNKKKLGLIFLTLGTLVVFQVSWNSYQQYRGLASDSRSIKGVLGGVLTGKSSLSKVDFEKISQNFATVFLSQQIHKEKVSLRYNESSYNIISKFKKSIKITTLGFLFFYLALIALSCFFTYETEKKKVIKLVGLSLFVVFIAYVFILYLGYVFAFGKGGLHIPSYVRYVNTGTLPLVFIAFALFLPLLQGNLKKETDLTQQKIFWANLGALFLLIVLTRPYFVPLYSQSSSNSKIQIKKITEILVKNISQDSSVYVVHPALKGSMFDPIIKYHLLPLQSFISPNDFHSKRPEEMKAIYSQYSHLWFLQLSKEIYQKNKDILQLKLTGKLFSLYSVDKIGDSSRYRALL